jgi:hypothetical protein
MRTINVKPWADGQGEFVIIDVASFNPKLHERLDGDDTPLPGPFDDHSRDQLIDLAVVSFREDMAGLSDDDLRRGLEALDRRRQREAEGPFNGADPDLFDHDGDGKPGGSLGNAPGARGGEELDRPDGAPVGEQVSGATTDGVILDPVAAKGLTKQEIIADLEGMGIEFDPRAAKADLLALRNEARAARDAQATIDAAAAVATQAEIDLGDDTQASGAGE